MPELPELEVMRDALEASVLGRTLAGARPYRPGILKTVVPPIEALDGERFQRVARRGKHLILSCRDDLHVVLHLMLAGQLVHCRTETKITKATGFAFCFTDGKDLRLIENGHVKRAMVHIVEDPSDVEWIARAGPEPLSDGFTVDMLASAFDGVRRQVKKLLTTPSVIAGIGTAYADEILFASKISPIRYASTLDRDEIQRIHDAIRRVLPEAIEQIRAQSGGSLLAGHNREFMEIYKKTGEPCPECGTKIAEIRYAQTKTYYCPRCQAKGKTLADRRSWLTR